jgi:hypothetical protein
MGHKSDVTNCAASHYRVSISDAKALVAIAEQDCSARGMPY